MDRKFRIKGMLKEHYNIHARHIEQLPGGWSALAYLITDYRQKYFLKVYDKRRAAAKLWIDAIDRYIPLVDWLQHHTVLKHHLAQSLLTKTKQHYCEDREYVYLLSEFVEGYTIGGNVLNLYQVNELAKILGTLHSSTAHVPPNLIQPQTQENFNTDFCDAFSSFIKHDLTSIHDNVLRVVRPFKQELMSSINRMKYLSNKLKQKSLPFVLCHADPHNWNIIQGRNLMLIDWECVTIAPKEQDLILHITPPYARQFIMEYKKYMPYQSLDLDAFEFYFLKRRLGDIWEWIKDLRYQQNIKSEDTVLKFLKLNIVDCTKRARFRAFLQPLI
ncbi:aminoglycoside phosphotransferase family protein [Lysinibacillus sp. KU-BSD001]|uniref:aminoglycoside phosphotransferase family protein n=1 Tax=Lysinibacillus sp. KU-BSD001 TaxID=3141328 RepID=UPI0036ED0530